MLVFETPGPPRQEKLQSLQRDLPSYLEYCRQGMACWLHDDPVYSWVTSPVVEALGISPQESRGCFLEKVWVTDIVKATKYDSGKGIRNGWEKRRRADRCAKDFLEKEIAFAKPKLALFFAGTVAREVFGREFRPIPLGGKNVPKVRSCSIESHDYRFLSTYFPTRRNSQYWTNWENQRSRFIELIRKVVAG